MTNTITKPLNSSLYNVQPTSDTTKLGIFPAHHKTKEILKFNNKFNYQFSDLTDTDYVTFCNLITKHKNCYATKKRCWKFFYCSY